MQKLEKNNERSLRYLKTDQRRDGPRTTDQRRLLRTPSGKPGVQYKIIVTEDPKSILDSQFSEMQHYGYEM